VKRLLQKEKEVSNKDYLIEGKEKTTWNTSGDLSNERRGDEDNGVNLQHVPQKITAIKKSRRNSHSAALGLQARLCAQHRDSRAVVLVMMEEEVALEVA
jgi:hypothetical protein